jgi:fibronectin-binding autotransporter adhesin
VAGNITGSSSFTANTSFRGVAGALTLITGTINAPGSNFDLNGSADVTISSTGNDYGGTTGILSVGSLILGANGALDAASRLDITGAGGLRLNGFSQSLQGLNSGSTGAAASITNTSATADSVLTLTPSATFGFTGRLADGGSRTLSLVMNGSGTQTLSGTGTYTGGTQIQAGELRLGSSAAIGASGSTGSLTVDGGRLNLNGFSAAVGTVSGSAGGVVTSASPATLTATANTNSTFAGSLTGAVALDKFGTGMLTLTGSSSSTGGIGVNSGTLAVNGIVGTGTVSVAASAWLQGSGTIAGAVSVIGTLSPGNSPGVITLGSVVLGGSSSTLIEIDGVTRGSQYDGVNITGTSSSLTYDGVLSLNFGSLSPNDVTYDIFNFTGGYLGNYTTVTSTGAYVGTWTNLGGSGTFQFVSGAQTLTFSPSTGDIIVVPEPAAVAVVGIGLGLAGLAVHRRRSSRRA